MSGKAALRLVYCSNRYFPARGGLEVFLKNVAGQMARKHRVTVIAACHDERSLVDSLLRPPPMDGMVTAESGRADVVAIRLSPISRFATHLLRVEPLLVSLAPREKYFAIRSAFTRYTAGLMRRALKPFIDEADLIHSFGPWEASHAVSQLRPKVPHIVTGFLHAGFWADDSFSL